MTACGVMLACALLLSCVSSVPKPTAQTHAQCQRPEPLHRKQQHTLKHLERGPPSDSFSTPPSAFIHRFKRSPKQRGFRSRTSRKKASRDEREKGKGRACALHHVQLKVSDLGLGYRSQEEMIFSYCSGVCINSLTNYDKILTSLAGGRKNILHSAPPTACCRPIEYDDNLSFLDDDLIYHTMERHSARKCGCV